MKLELGLYPTAVYRLEKLEKAINSKSQIWIKREDQSGLEYGGNKVRKLDHILSNALKKRSKTVFSFGAAGSNHVLATTIYAKKMGIKNVAFLFPQEKQDYVRDNLFSNLFHGAKLVYISHLLYPLVPFLFFYHYFKSWIQDLKKPYLVWFGGSSIEGTQGSYELGLELAEQIKKNQIPSPDFIFVPVGTCGTMSGLVLSMKKINPQIRVIGIAVFPKLGANIRTIVNLANGVSSKLNLGIKVNSKDFDLITEYLGTGYAHFTEDGIKAQKLMKESEDILLDGTYTAKTLAALIDVAKKEENKIILFVHTYNSRPLEKSKKEIPQLKYYLA